MNETNFKKAFNISSLLFFFTNYTFDIRIVFVLIEIRIRPLPLFPVYCFNVEVLSFELGVVDKTACCSPFFIFLFFLKIYFTLLKNKFDKFDIEIHHVVG